MKAFVGVTDYDWFTQLRALAPGEVNFWQPSGKTRFGALEPGDLFLFKLHSPRNFVVGGGVFAHFSLLPISMAWSAFGTGNGVRDLTEMRERVSRYRRSAVDRHQDYTIGCIVLTQPFFLPDEHWIPVPEDWKPNIVRGKTYDLSTGPGFLLLEACRQALALSTVEPALEHELSVATDARFGKAGLVRPRLGQGAFRVLVTDAYDRRCAATGERVLPVLEAAHVRPYAVDGKHELANGLLLRSDLHTLLDRGYVTVTPHLQLEVSHRIREDFENGREYYALQGREISVPAGVGRRPAEENLVWHNENVYLG